MKQNQSRGPGGRSCTVCLRARVLTEFGRGRRAAPHLRSGSQAVSGVPPTIPDSLHFTETRLVAGSHLVPFHFLLTRHPPDRLAPTLHNDGQRQPGAPGPVHLPG